MNDWKALAEQFLLGLTMPAELVACVESTTSPIVYVVWTKVDTPIPERPFNVHVLDLEGRVMRSGEYDLSISEALDFVIQVDRGVTL